MSEPTITNRGFARFDEIPSTYGGSIRVYESSNAEGPHLWVRTESPVDLNQPWGDMKEGVAHLRLEDARLLRDQLTWLIDHHYQEGR